MKRLRVMGAGALALALMAAAAEAAAESPASVFGLWLTESGDAKVELAPCGREVCGRIVWLEKGLNDDGSTMTDKHNPDQTRREQPLIGLQILSGFSAGAPGEWDGGRIYSPRDGETYKARMRLDGNDTLRLRGYVGVPLLGKTEVWTRVVDAGDGGTAAGGQ